ncbi:hypothetical protein GW7_09241 [Heterocephalus glaber]|uniref:Uncharacterized protein n=1 Tax=Heterocephalus glaber TaxID=10181 RepID=G5C0A9_HETGA|nr:hypothetical protein GW7_09241 [Heterocephalus glaber]
MIREWENGCPRIGIQRAKERDTEEGKSDKNGKTVRILSTSCSYLHQASPCCQEDLGYGPNSTNSMYCPRKIFPLEKEILEIKVKVAFKSKESRRCLPCQPNDCKPFFPIKTLERSITGLTNRNLLSVTEFPRDLMLMNQDFISREIYSRNVINTHPLQEGHACKECVGKAAPCNY